MAESGENSKKVRRRSFRKEKTLRFSHLPPEARHQFEKLKSSLSLGNPAQKVKSILISSYNHGEGTSTVAANFAECLAQDMNLKILLVDANTRRPSLHRVFNPKGSSNTPGFSEIVIKQTVTPALPKPSSSSNLSFVPCGSITHHPSGVFNHALFKAFSHKAKQLYDFVIFDSSPLGRYYDSIVLASNLDGVILVVEAEKTTSYDLKRAKEMLQDKNIHLLGVILNKRKFPIPRFVFERFF